MGAIRDTDPVDLQAVFSSALLATVTGGVGYGASVLTQRRSLRRELRVATADGIVPALETVRRLVRYAPAQGDAGEWFAASAAALDAIDGELHRLPRSWRHLQQSVRITIGEASGAAAFADRRTPPRDVELAPYCPLWMDHAESYLTYTIRSLREWRDEIGVGRRTSVRLLAFDPWLDQTGRAGQRCGCGPHRPSSIQQPASR